MMGSLILVARLLGETTALRLRDMLPIQKDKSSVLPARQGLFRQPQSWLQLGRKSTATVSYSCGTQAPDNALTGNWADL